MINYEDALKIILNNVRSMDTEEKQLLRARGQVLAEDIYAGIDLPGMASSGPDGYAVRSADIQGADKQNPVILRIIETARAGRLPQKNVTPGTAIRIMTGAVLPAGADCVVRFEDTDEPENKNGPNKLNPQIVKIYVTAKPGTNVRPVGSNLKKGSVVLSQGTVIGPAQISIMTLIGQTNVKVHRRPVIAVIATGDELAKPGSTLSAGKTWDANTGAVTALVSHFGGIPRILGFARDNEVSLTRKILRAMTADVIITSGGVSKGDYDLVRLVLAQLGELHFARIKMGPGASFAFGTVGNDTQKTIPFFALSGPPWGCLINFETLVRPALLKMLGRTDVDHPVVEAVATDAITDKKPMSFVKWTLLKKVGGRYHVTLNLPDSSGAFFASAAANSLTIIPAGNMVQPGDKIPVLPLDWDVNPV